MITRYLQISARYKMSCVGGVRALGFCASHRAVLQGVPGALFWLKCLIVRLLNDIYVVVDVIKCAYLCEAKVPYYGRSTYRH
jgi:hypothetical protein